MLYVCACVCSLNIFCQFICQFYIYNNIENSIHDLSNFRLQLTTQYETLEKEKIQTFSQIPFLTIPSSLICLYHSHVANIRILISWNHILVLFSLDAVSNLLPGHLQFFYQVSPSMPWLVVWLFLGLLRNLNGCNILGTCIFAVVYCSIQYTFFRSHFISHEC